MSNAVISTILTTIRTLLDDINKIEEEIKFTATGPITTDLGAHLPSFIEAVANFEQDIVKEEAELLKIQGLSLIQIIEKGEKISILEQSMKVRCMVETFQKKMRTFREKTPKVAKTIDLKAVRALCSNEIKNTLYNLNTAYKENDQQKGDQVMETLMKQCQTVCSFGTENGLDVKTIVDSPLKKINDIRKTDGADQQLKAGLKELHKAFKSIQANYKAHNEKTLRALKNKIGSVNDQASMQKYIEKKDPSHLFTLEEEIGRGAFGSVFKGIAINGEPYAIKRLSINAKTLGATNKEIKFMKNIQHPNTLKYHKCYAKENEIWIVMELCEGGSIEDILESRDKGLEEKYIQAICAQVLNGLDYLHQQQKIHRDIKSGNLLLTSSGEVKIADFGTSAETHAKRTTVIGSSYWMAPETLDQQGYDSKADIWSLGITLIEMAEKNPPYLGLEPYEVVLQVTHNPPPTFQNPSLWSNNFQDFVKVCLQKDPTKRLSAQELLQHKFVTTADPKCLLELAKQKMIEKKKF